MATYLLEALENYPPAMVAGIEGESLGSGLFFAEQSYFALGYDRINARFVYPATKIYGTTPFTTTNDSGYTLWNGAITIAPDAEYNGRFNHNLWIGFKDRDTGAVTWSTTWSEDETVPAGIGGGDGSWRRYVSDTQTRHNTPHICDPRTGNVWIHVQSCDLHCFRTEDDFVQTLSPISPVVDPLSNSVVPIGMNVDWTFAMEDQYPDGLFLYLIPRLRTAEEIAQDKLLAYATFEFPFSPEHYYRFCTGEDGALWVFSYPSSGDFDFKLHRFDQPSSAPYGGPTVGGGFSDETPWASDTGPNAPAVDYTVGGEQAGRSNQALIYRLGAEDFALVTQLLMEDGGDYQFGVTYFNTSGTFEQHSGVVTAFMSAAWEPTTAEEAYFFPRYVREIDQDVQMHDYVFDGFDYGKRWFLFAVGYVEGAIDFGAVLVQYQFTPGEPPEVLQVIDTEAWDAAYPAYVGAIGGLVVENSLSPKADWSMPLFGTYNDGGIWDPDTNAFWFSGYSNNFWLFDGAFTPRDIEQGGEAVYGQPFLRMAVDPPEDDTVDASAAIIGGGFLTVTVRSFECQLDSETTWESLTPEADAWACATADEDGWVCVGDLPALGYGLLIDTSGGYLTYINGGRIKLI